MRSAVLLALAFGCAPAEPTCDEAPGRGAPVGGHGNVLVVVLDDVGVDKVSAYGLHPAAPPTPTLDALAASGVRFDRAYAEPSCSPTRASLLTGRHPSRHGIGEWILPKGDEVELPDEELTVPELLRLADEPWSTALVGKWHLSVFDGEQPELDPQAQGFDHFVGLLGNPDMATRSDGRPRGYRHWERVDDGVLSWDDRWLTSVQVDDAIAVLAELPEPWFVEVAFSAAHAPLEDPPKALPGDPFDRVLQDLDAELARLLEHVDLGETTVVALGDNGTPREAVQPPWDPTRAKGTVFDAGVRVPLIVAGVGVERPGTISQELVHATDVFATVADLAGIDVTELEVAIDGRSLMPWTRGEDGTGRRCVMVERFEDGGGNEARAVLTRDWELIRDRHGLALHEVSASPGEQGDDRIDDGSAEVEAVRRSLLEELRRYDRALR